MKGDIIDRKGVLHVMEELGSSINDLIAPSGLMRYVEIAKRNYNTKDKYKDDVFNPEGKLETLLTYIAPYAKTKRNEYYTALNCHHDFTLSLPALYNEFQPIPFELNKDLQHKSYLFTVKLEQALKGWRRKRKLGRVEEFLMEELLHFMRLMKKGRTKACEPSMSRKRLAWIGLLTAIQNGDNLLKKITNDGRTFRDLLISHGIYTAAEHKEVIDNFHKFLAAFGPIYLQYLDGEISKKELTLFEWSSDKQLHAKILFPVSVADIAKVIYRMQESVRALEIRLDLLSELNGDELALNAKIAENYAKRNQIYDLIYYNLSKLAEVEYSAENNNTSKNGKIITNIESIRDLERLINNLFQDVRREERQLIVGIASSKVDALLKLSDKVDKRLERNYARIQYELAKGRNDRLEQSIIDSYKSIAALLATRGICKNDIAKYIVLYFRWKNIDLNAVGLRKFHYYLHLSLNSCVHERASWRQKLMLQGHLFFRIIAHILPSLKEFLTSTHSLSSIVKYEVKRIEFYLEMINEGEIKTAKG